MSTNAAAAKKPTGRGGAGRGQGRKRLVKDGESVVIPIRATPEQKEKFHALGGAEWFRRMVDRAKVPTSKEGA